MEVFKLFFVFFPFHFFGIVLHLSQTCYHTRFSQLAHVSEASTSTNLLNNLQNNIFMICFCHPFNTATVEQFFNSLFQNTISRILYRSFKKTVTGAAGISCMFHLAGFHHQQIRDPEELKQGSLYKVHCAEHEKTYHTVELSLSFTSAASVLCHHLCPADELLTVALECLLKSQCRRSSCVLFTHCCNIVSFYPNGSELNDFTL